MKKLICIALTAIVTIGCSSSKPTIKTYTDEFSGTKFHATKNNALPHKGGLLNIVAVSMNAVATPEIDSLAQIQIKYGAEEWMFIKNGQSLNIKIDGKIYHLSTLKAPDTEVINWLIVKEVAYYPVKPRMFYKIGTGKTVMIRLIGREGTLTRTLSKENKKLFLKFYNKFYSNK